MPLRVLAFVDGFNLYHAVKALERRELLWLDLWALSRVFAPTPDNDLVAVRYFSAFATWLAGPYKRHRAYVQALEAVGVTPLMARFKPKSRTCYECGNRWKDHEEKETDVSIAVNLLDAAYSDEFDKTLLLSGDSDLVPAVKLVRRRFPDKRVQLVGPPERKASRDLEQVCNGRPRIIKRIHLQRSLLPASLHSPSFGEVVRPKEYDPPGST